MSREERLNNLRCLRCGGRMEYVLTNDIQLGRTTLFSGHLPNLMAGAVPAEIYCCKECGRLEFFSAGEPETSELPQKTCPECGRSHDFDYPRCPFCRHEY